MPQTLPMALEIEPKDGKLYFKGPYTEFSPATIYMKNVATHYIAFKIKLTAPRWYQVKPVSGILMPGQRQNVDIFLVPLIGPEIPDIANPFDRKKDKFLVQAAYVEKYNKDVGRILNAASEVNALMESKFSCVFDEIALNAAAKEGSSSINARSIRTNASQGPNGLPGPFVEGGEESDSLFSMVVMLVVLIISAIYISKIFGR